MQPSQQRWRSKDQSVCSAFVPDKRFCAASSCSILLLYHNRSCRPSISKILICISPKVIALANLERAAHPLGALSLSVSLPILSFSPAVCLSLPPARSSARRRTKGALDGGGTSSFPSQNTLSPPVSGLSYCPCLRCAAAAGTWDSQRLFDVALFQAL